MSAQRRITFVQCLPNVERRWADIVQMLYKCFVFAGNIHFVSMLTKYKVCSISRMVEGSNDNNSEGTLTKYSEDIKYHTHVPSRM